jgi:hypothetical protein
MKQQETYDIEKLYGIFLQPRERVLLTSRGDLLSHLEKQESYLLRMALSPVPCPSCGIITCQYAALPEGESPLSCPDDAYRCPRCNVPLVWHLALTGQQFFTVNFPKHNQERMDDTEAL